MSVNNKEPKSELGKMICQRIDEHGGWLPFDQFMRLALYAPGAGYYESEHVFGEKGDFVTAADMGPWLGLGFADLVAWAWHELGSPEHWCLLEQGGGSGRLLAQLVRHLSALPIPMPKIICIETSQRMQLAQQSTLDQAGIQLDIFASWDALHEQAASVLNSPDGSRMPVVMLSNELPDAFPVRCFVKHGAELFERGVTYHDEVFGWADAASPIAAGTLPIEQARIDAWPDGYISEWNPNLDAWQKDIAACIERCFILTVDYGYTQQEYYRQNRQEGTLMGHWHHEVIHDVLSQMWHHAGSMDITAHIDFTALAKAGLMRDIQTLTFTTQGAWLAQSPSVQQQVQQCAQHPSVDSMRDMAFAKQLLMPFGMGETFKLMVQSRGLDKRLSPPYLQAFDHLVKLAL
ncbi:MAG: SAM-dependent methyltransferase [Zetaproteobacteria bacterium CG_4_9_14_3_um_filter_49_83]|nr:MAG: hypothetical protein AUJ56_01555 [Zetaproteobacteria bacterium CG1_02_49_23]PIQ33985.1 MAG: SAM-dependent methyltransferase [Zetaproteobacteria bacterium CG17_big_fil_post_rev_8_21_14_2_50_50_13]PIV30536.1 MAG: SAM-dependent methyltransferase [Zetaproteobacteria bacterium CG02_land_8_20_14_3_00_50_9]PIY56500.1 MAG: SAM-dependent methyltransferase [Zetaproteobacteria bacterium CG_4_10_14_0_8_um_filter_49_80]PJA33795.1 MAG: SAM-dependent methyltransferase [Zetaproteobacteria bacterium CG_